MMSSFIDLPGEQFPLTIRAFRRRDGREVWSAEVAEPGATYVPPLIIEHGPVRIRVEFGDGSIIDDGVLVGPNKCPYCSYVTPTAEAGSERGWQEVAHMQTEHPEIIDERLKTAGLSPKVDPGFGRFAE